jgi:hypothetical protein
MFPRDKSQLKVLQQIGVIRNPRNQPRMERLKTYIFFFLASFFLLNSSYILAEEPYSPNSPDHIPVFPGAVGFGSETVAGRGGMIIKVTNLNSAGNGSLKAALDAPVPRVVVFEVAGTINLTGDLFIRNPYITIAGQTAPSPGITIRGASITVLTHDVLIQHIRIRVGDSPFGPAKNDRDALKIHNNYKETYNVVVDHCSFSWSIDENVSVAHPGIYNISFTNCIISEGLYIAGHPEYPAGTPHSKGLMIGPGVTNVTVYGNLFAHNHQRNIQVGDPSSGNIEQVNNLIYNWGSTAADTYGDLNVIGNHFIPGINTTGPSLQVRSNIANLYAYDNIGATWRRENFSRLTPAIKSLIPVSRIMPSSDVYDYILKNAGARPSDRDTVDKRIIHEVQTRTGSFRNSVAEAGGWPDHGIRRRSLSSNIREAGPMPMKFYADTDGNGYTDLEEWLHKLSSLLNISVIAD